MNSKNTRFGDYLDKIVSERSMERYELKRMNIEYDDEGLLICFDHHAKGQACEYERLTPKQLHDLICRMQSLL